MKTLLVESHGACTTVRLHRPDARNAMNAEMITELTAVFTGLDVTTRLVVLTGEGAAFCAGADLQWMKASAAFSESDNRQDAQNLAALFRAVDRAAAVVIGKVNGTAMGGALGLLACCDMVVAVDTARFGFTEVRLGLVPAVISPYVLAKIGISNGRRYFITGEVFGAHTAQAIGLVHRVVEPGKLDHAVGEWASSVLQCGPKAVRAAKELVRTVPLLEDDAAMAYAVDTIARLRVSSEGQEGLAAFLDKRKPDWTN